VAQNKQYILSVNYGSSSIKYAIYEIKHLKCTWRGLITGIGTAEAFFRVADHSGKQTIVDMQCCKDSTAAFDELRNWLGNHYRKYPITAIGHRIVQGGPNHRSAELIDEQLISELEQLTYLAPNHLPDELAAIRVLKNTFPEALQIACYDTSFHNNMPEFVKNYPFAEEYRHKGLLKYGFHGLSYEYVLDQLKNECDHISHKKIIIAHLGNGASMVAIRHVQSVDTTMGLSPAGGLLMGTRSGDIDPGVPVLLLKQWKLSAEELDELFNKKSGLKAIAGTADMRELLELASSDIKAAEAVAAFIYSVIKNIGALTAAMGGLDLLVFTGGIGENAAYIRERICQDLGFLGIKVHKGHNKHSRRTISSKSSKIAVMVIPTDEEYVIARHTHQIINRKINVL